MSACTDAAEAGNLEELKRLRQLENTPWSEETTLAAAKEGHLEVLRWLLREGCPYQIRELLNLSTQNGHTEVLKWLHAKFCSPHTENTAGKCLLNSLISEAAGIGGYPEVVEYLHEVDKVSGDSFFCEEICEAAAFHNHVGVFEWMIEKEVDDFELTAGICSAAIKGRSIKVLQFIREQSHFEIDKELCFAAIAEDRLDMLKLCIDNGCQWSVHDRDSTGKTGVEIAQAKGHTHIDMTALMSIVGRSRGNRFWHT